MLGLFLGYGNVYSYGSNYGRYGYGYGYGGYPSSIWLYRPPYRYGGYNYGYGLGRYNGWGYRGLW